MAKAQARCASKSPVSEKRATTTKFSAAVPKRSEVDHSGKTSPAASERPVRLLFAVALLMRVVLVLFGEWQDAHLALKYTDVDYAVFTDAARLVSKGRFAGRPGPRCSRPCGKRPRSASRA